jgi:uncharacterized membrane protein
MLLTDEYRMRTESMTSVANRPAGQLPYAGGELRSLISGKQVNVGRGERLASLAAGTILAVWGIRRADLPGLVAAIAAGGLVWRGATGHSLLYQALELDTADGRAAGTTERGVHVTHSFSIDKSPEELYAYWRKLENLPTIMTHLESVRVIDDRLSHWVAKAPAIAGGTVEWDAEITADEPGTRIAWRSLPDSSVASNGSVEFAPGRGDRGTAVRVVVNYQPPAGQIGHWISKLFGQAADQQIREDLRNFKRMMEIGEIPTVAGQPRGACSGSLPRILV